jgi:hypothetical protein
MSHLGKSGFRSNLLSIACIADLVREIPSGTPENNNHAGGEG